MGIRTLGIFSADNDLRRRPEPDGMLGSMHTFSGGDVHRSNLRFSLEERLLVADFARYSSGVKMAILFPKAD